MATADGTVTFDVAGQQRRLRFTTNALCLLEDKVGLTTMQVAEELAFGKEMPLGVSAKTLRAIFWAGSGDGDLTLAQAGDVVDGLGQRRAVVLAIEAFDAAFPDAEDAKGDESPPPPAPVG